MMGPAKLSTMRAEVRKAFAMSNAELLAWFNRQLGDLRRTPKANKGEMETLRLLRDALIKEAKRGVRRHRPPRVSGQSKS